MPNSMEVFVVEGSSADSPTNNTIKTVQFNVGETEDRSDNQQKTILSDNETTITANLQSWRNMQTLDVSFNQLDC